MQRFEDEIKNLTPRQVIYINKKTGLVVSQERLKEMRRDNNTSVMLQALEPISPISFPLDPRDLKQSVQKYEYLISEIPFHEDWITDVIKETDLERDDLRECIRVFTFYQAQCGGVSYNISKIINKFHNAKSENDLLRKRF